MYQPSERIVAITFKLIFSIRLRKRFCLSDTVLESSDFVRLLVATNQFEVITSETADESGRVSAACSEEFSWNKVTDNAVTEIEDISEAKRRMKMTRVVWTRIRSSTTPGRHAERVS